MRSETSAQINKEMHETEWGNQGKGRIPQPYYPRLHTRSPVDGDTGKRVGYYSKHNTEMVEFDHSIWQLKVCLTKCIIRSQGNEVPPHHNRPPHHPSSKYTGHAEAILKNWIIKVELRLKARKLPCNHQLVYTMQPNANPNANSKVAPVGEFPTSVRYHMQNPLRPDSF